MEFYFPYFNPGQPERRAELDECLVRNANNTLISHIHLLTDEDVVLPPLLAKTSIIRFSQRPTYHDWIACARHSRGIGVLANADIYFDESASLLPGLLARPRTFVALTRHDWRNGSLHPHPNPRWSQDCWALNFDQDLPQSLVDQLRIPLGVPRCDNKAAYVFAIHGWRIVNPFPEIHAVHLHTSARRTYTKTHDTTVLGGCAYVYPLDPPADESRIDLDVWITRSSAIGKVTLNKTLEQWREQAKKGADAAVTDPTTENGHQPAAATSYSYALSERTTNSPLVDSILREGTRLHRLHRRFTLHDHDETLFAIDHLTNSVRRLATSPTALSEDPMQAAGDLLSLVPACINTYPIEVRLVEGAPATSHFWQYPCLTEYAAFANHLALGPTGRVHPDGRHVDTHLGLPWATYIDCRSLPADALQPIRINIAGLRKLARSAGLKLRVHTVVQSIHWRRILGIVESLGVTDLHLSHWTAEDASSNPSKAVAFHAWPLYAVNHEDRRRRTGLQANLPVGEKTYLASFIGAHMKHYRSDIRLRLQDIVKTSQCEDILFALKDEWHFNPVVFGEQVSGKKCTPGDRDSLQDSTQFYNRVLSNSVFSLCPEGAGPNTLRLWESLAVGSIPVIFSDAWNRQNLAQSELRDLQHCCLFFSSADAGTFIDVLRSYSRDQLAEMQFRCIETYARYRRMTAFSTLAEDSSATAPTAEQVLTRE